MPNKHFPVAIALALAFAIIGRSAASQSSAPGPDQWKLANDCASVHRFSTLFTSHDVREYLSKDEKLQAAVAWCKTTGVTKVYLEEFRDGYQAERTVLENAREKFRGARFEVSGCVTTTRVGKPSTGWKEVACCYTDQATQDKLQAIFEYAASLFDEIMIDDFWFTDCTCPACESARKARTVTVGEKIYPVTGDTWEDYRCELMLRVSQDRLLGPAKRVNPKARLIVKYPQWYDNFHVRGYDVSRETAAFDRIWVGTETRDFQDKQWGGTPQYEAYFIMRWLGGIGGAKCGGGWYDPYGTTPQTYLEQARQTILGGGRESMLFEYSSLLRETGPKNIEALRAALPELLAAAKEVPRRHPIGLAAYKPPNSHPQQEPRVFDFVGMLGLPLVPCHEFPTNAPAAFFSIHAVKDSDFVAKLDGFVKSGKPVLLTDGLEKALKGRLELGTPNVHVLAVQGDPKSLLLLDQASLDPLRDLFLPKVHASFRGPNRVGLYLFSDGSWVVENFNDVPARVELDGKQLDVPPRGWTQHWVN
ncbi:MAG TPA: hypothetical protein VFE51_28210 [Verrucomicrobiae bacterium]|nr:hypothetical protein [Verrucomicrobiae bacterium]